MAIFNSYVKLPDEYALVLFFTQKMGCSDASKHDPCCGSMSTEHLHLGDPKPSPSLATCTVHLATFLYVLLPPGSSHAMAIFCYAPPFLCPQVMNKSDTTQWFLRVYLMVGDAGLDTHWHHWPIVKTSAHQLGKGQPFPKTGAFASSPASQCASAHRFPVCI